MKNEDLLHSLPEEQILGVLWKTEEDLLKFKVFIKDKLTTRSGILSILISTYNLLGFGAPFLSESFQSLST